MKKRSTIVLILIIILLAVAGLVSLRIRSKNHLGTGSVSSEAAATETSETGEEKPLSKEEIIKEFEKELDEEGETIDPDQFSDYTDEYVIDVKDDESVEIH